MAATSRELLDVLIQFREASDCLERARSKALGLSEGDLGFPKAEDFEIGLHKLTLNGSGSWSDGDRAYADPSWPVLIRKIDDSLVAWHAVLETAIKTVQATAPTQWLDNAFRQRICVYLLTQRDRSHAPHKPWTFDQLQGEYLVDIRWLDVTPLAEFICELEAAELLSAAQPQLETPAPKSSRGVLDFESDPRRHDPPSVVVNDVLVDRHYHGGNTVTRSLGSPIRVKYQADGQKPQEWTDLTQIDPDAIQPYPVGAAGYHGALDQHEVAVLQKLKAAAPRMPRQYELEAEPEPLSQSRKTVGIALGSLTEKGLVHRPAGPNSGYALTELGNETTARLD